MKEIAKRLLRNETCETCSYNVDIGSRLYELIKCLASSLPDESRGCSKWTIDEYEEIFSEMDENE